MPLTAMPRIFTEEEHALLARGTAQRARAFRAFYEDYMGVQRFRDAVVPASVIDAIVDRTGEAPLRRAAILRGARGRLRAFFAPDVIRAADGRFHVLEDNFHFVGGPGDLEPARAAHEVLLPGFAGAIGALNQPRTFLDEVVAHAHEVADPPIGPNPDQGAFVVYGTPPYTDEEDQRLYAMLEARHAVVVEPGMKDKWIEIDEDGAYLVQRLGIGKTEMSYRKKIGFLWMNAEYAWVDPRDPAIRAKALLDEAREHLDDRDLRARPRARIQAAMTPDPATGRVCLRKLERALRRSNIEIVGSVLEEPVVPGIVDLILRGKVQASATPGVDFMGDKVFYSYVPDLVRFYLAEEPLLPNVPTHLLFDVGARGRTTPRTELIRHVMEHRERYVIKAADGRGGDAVWIGPRMADKPWQRLERLLVAEPTRYVVQDFAHPSVLSGPWGEDRRIVDSRLLSMILDERIHVTGTSWGRSSVLEGGDGKVNLSLSGIETVGYIVPDADGAQAPAPLTIPP